jgi:hypothetical protein
MGLAGGGCSIATVPAVPGWTGTPHPPSAAAGATGQHADHQAAPTYFRDDQLDAGVDPRDIQIAARHADSRTTMRYDRHARTFDRHTRTTSLLPTWPPAADHSAAFAIAADAYSIRCMASLYEVEIEPEVRSWLASLSDRDFGRVDFLVGLLAERTEDLGEPYTRHLGGKVRELRFHLVRQQTRVTYWLAPGRRVILLTVFRKTRSAETAEVARALHA